MQFARLFGIVPLGIGLSVIGFLWSAPFGAFGSPPLFFRIFGSFIALAFVMVGGTILFGKSIFESQLEHIRRLHEHARQQANSVADSQETPSDGYSCPGCGAPLASQADVSPHGDVKCEHCDRWYNIHS